MNIICNKGTIRISHWFDRETNEIHTNISFPNGHYILIDGMKKERWKYVGSKGGNCGIFKEYIRLKPLTSEEIKMKLIKSLIKELGGVK